MLNERISAVEFKFEVESTLVCVVVIIIMLSLVETWISINVNVKKSNLPFRVLFVLKEGKRETREGEKKGNKLAGEKLPKFETANQTPDTTKSQPQYALSRVQ